MTMKRKPRNLDNGSFYVSRKIFKGDMRGDPHLLLVWVTCLGWAYWRDGSDCHGGKQQIIKRGQFATSAYELGETLGISRNIVLRCLNRLSIDARIRLDKSPHGTLITVLNYDKYQASAEGDQLGKQQASNQVPLQQHDSSMTAAQQQQPHNKKSNKVTKEKGNKEKGYEQPPTEDGSLFNQVIDITAESDSKAIEISEGQQSTKAKKAPQKANTPSSGVWQAYREAYTTRYGTEPVRNAKVNGQIAQLVARLGGDAAQKVIRFYLTSNNSFYIRNCHAIGLCLKDAEALHTQMTANYRMTETESRTIDKNQAIDNVFSRVMARRSQEGKL